VMLALAYDAALSPGRVCACVRTMWIGTRTLRCGAETTKNRLERVVALLGTTGVLLAGYLAHRAT